MITIYTKRSLALEYFPTCAPYSKTPVRHLMRWINRCPPLLRELTATGYHPSQKIFTARQVAIIRDYLGSPG